MHILRSLLATLYILPAYTLAAAVPDPTSAPVAEPKAISQDSPGTAEVADLPNEWKIKIWLEDRCIPDPPTTPNQPPTYSLRSTGMTWGLFNPEGTILYLDYENHHLIQFDLTESLNINYLILGGWGGGLQIGPLESQPNGPRRLDFKQGERCVWWDDVASTCGGCQRGQWSDLSSDDKVITCTGGGYFRSREMDCWFVPTP